MVDRPTLVGVRLGNAGTSSTRPETISWHVVRVRGASDGVHFILLVSARNDITLYQKIGTLPCTTKAQHDDTVVRARNSRRDAVEAYSWGF